MALPVPSINASIDAFYTVNYSRSTRLRQKLSDCCLVSLIAIVSLHTLIAAWKRVAPTKMPKILSKISLEGPRWKLFLVPLVFGVVARPLSSQPYLHSLWASDWGSYDMKIAMQRGSAAEETTEDRLRGLKKIAQQQGLLTGNGEPTVFELPKNKIKQDTWNDVKDKIKGAKVTKQLLVNYSWFALEVARNWASYRDESVHSPILLDLKIWGNIIENRLKFQDYQPIEF